VSFVLIDRELCMDRCEQRRIVESEQKGIHVDERVLAYFD
jgi:hypothetical protein